MLDGDDEDAGDADRDGRSIWVFDGKLMDGNSLFMVR